MSGGEDLTPRVGLVIRYSNADGSAQRLECVQIKQGQSAKFAVWATHCADSGHRFTVATAVKARIMRHRQRGMHATRCPACRPGIRRGE